MSIVTISSCHIFWASLANCLGANLYALGSNGFNLGFEMLTSLTVFGSGVSFAGTWEIGASSTVVREFGTVAPLTGVGILGVRESIADFEAHGVFESLENV